MADFDMFPTASTDAPMQSTGDEPFGMFPASGTGPTFKQQAGAVAEQAPSLLSTGGAAAGAVAGAKLGMAGAPVLGPIAPIAGMVAGGVGGYFAGREAEQGVRSQFGLRNPEDLPPELRSAGYAGESFFGSMGTLGTPYGLARTGVRFGAGPVGNYLNYIVNAARTSPKATAAVETSMALGAASGAGLAESVAPGSPGARLAGEVAGGLFNPVSVVDRGWNTARLIYSTAASKLTDRTQAERVGKEVNRLLTEAGEDPQIISRILKDNAVTIGTNNYAVTAAQLTGSPTLAAIEKNLSQYSPQFGAQTQKKADDAFDAMRMMVQSLRQTGSPEAMREASEILNTYYSTILDARIKSATQRATESVRKLRKDPNATKDQMGIVAREVLDDSLAQARKAQDELWSKVTSTEKFGVTNLQAAVDQILKGSAEELVGQKIDPRIFKLIDRATTPGKGKTVYDETTFSLIDLPGDAPGVSLTDLMDFRTWILAEGRKSARQAEGAVDARVAGILEDAIMKDIDAVMAQSGDAAYDNARQFTRALHDTYTRSFTGKLLAESARGAAVMPEMTLTRAFAGGDQAANLQLSDIERATQFAITQAAGDPSNFDKLLSAQDQMFRIIASASTDSQGLVKPEKLQSFILNNKQLMSRFPEVRDDLLRATKDAEGLRYTQQMVDRLNKSIKTSPMTRILGSDTVTVAKRAIASPNREAEIDKLLKLAQKGAQQSVRPRQQVTRGITPDEAVDDLRASMMQAVIDQATRLEANRGQVLDLGFLRNLLFDAPSSGEKPLTQIMTEKGLMPAAHLKNLRTLFDQFDAITRTQKPGTAVDVKEGIGDILTSLVARIAGSKAAGMLKQATGFQGGGDIVVSSAAARAGDAIFNRMPKTRDKDLMIQLFNDPKGLAIAMEKATTEAEKLRLFRRFNAWLVQSGLTAPEDFSAQEQVQDYRRPPEAPQFFTR